MSEYRDPFGAGVRFCAHHESRMKSAVQGLGLWPRVSKTVEELRARLAKNNPYDPDPLMLLHNMVIGRARHMAALNDVALERECPVCVFAVERWIDEAAAAVAARLVALDTEAAVQRAWNEELEARARS